MVWHHQIPDESPHIQTRPPLSFSFISTSSSSSSLPSLTCVSMFIIIIIRIIKHTKKKVGVHPTRRCIAYQTKPKQPCNQTNESERKRSTCPSLMATHHLVITYHSRHVTRRRQWHFFSCLGVYKQANVCAQCIIDTYTHTYTHRKRKINATQMGQRMRSCLDI